MNKNLPKHHTKSKGIAHLGIIAALGVLLLVASGVYFVNNSETPPDEDDVMTDGSGYPAVTIEDGGRDVEVDMNEDVPTDNQDQEKEDKGRPMTVHFNDDCVTGTQDPMTMEICSSNAWAQNCSGPYGRWEGTAHQRTSLKTSAGEDVREGDGDFDFVLNKNDGKLSSDGRTITLKHKVNCYYCDDPWFYLTGTIKEGASGCN